MAYNATNEITSRTIVTQAQKNWINETFSDNDLWTIPDLNNNATADDGAWAVSGNMLQCNTAVAVSGGAPNSNGSIQLLPGTYQDIRLRVDVTFTGGGAKDGGIVFGYQDYQNYWVLMANVTNTNYELWQVSGGTWTRRRQSFASLVSTDSTYTLSVEVRSGSATLMVMEGGNPLSDYRSAGAFPAGRVGVWAGSGSATVKFDDFVVRSLAAGLAVDGRFTEDVGNVRIDDNKLEFHTDGVTRRSVLRHVRLGVGIVQVAWTFQTGIDAGVILNYQDAENFGVALLDNTSSNNLVVRYIEFVDGQAAATRASGSSFSLTATNPYPVQCVITESGGNQTLEVFVDGASRLSTGTIDDTWSAGRVGLFRGTSTTTTTLAWDNFKCGLDANSDGDIGDPGDYVYADYNFNSSWLTLALGHDDNGNLTNDGLHQYKYDAWNRLAGVWYAAGDATESAERVARYEYDGLFRRIEKEVTNQGLGIVHGSDAGGAEGVLAGDRFERYYYAGWRVVELRDNAETNQTLGQFVYGTQYMDEPIAYDRDTDGDDDCVEAEGSRRYFYHQDANYRVAALTDEDGFVVERYEYDAYGEPVVYNGGTSSELGNALPASTVGNPLMHQGLWRDGESGSYQNRYRQYASALGRFGQRDPLGYGDGLNLLEYQRAASLLRLDALGQCSMFEDDLVSDVEKEFKNHERHRIQSKDAFNSVLYTGASIVLIAGTAAVEVCVQGVCIAIPAEWLALQGIKIVGNTLVRAETVLTSTEVMVTVGKYVKNAGDEVKAAVKAALDKANEILRTQGKEQYKIMQEWLGPALEGAAKAGPAPATITTDTLRAYKEVILTNLARGVEDKTGIVAKRVSMIDDAIRSRGELP